MIRVCRRRPCCDLRPTDGTTGFSSQRNPSTPRSDDRDAGGCFFGVDFWHAVEFSRNGRFLRCGSLRALRALTLVLLFFLPFYRTAFYRWCLTFWCFVFRVSSLAHRVVRFTVPLSPSGPGFFRFPC